MPHKNIHEKNSAGNDDDVTYDEKELEILREAVDLVEKKKGEAIIHDPKVKKIISIVEDFIADKKLV
jgi:hypothetical protein